MGSSCWRRVGATVAPVSQLGTYARTTVVGLTTAQPSNAVEAAVCAYRTPLRGEWAPKNTVEGAWVRVVEWASLHGCVGVWVCHGYSTL